MSQGKGLCVPAFDGLVIFEMRLPSVRVDRERNRWFTALEKAEVIPPLGTLTGEHMPEVQLCQLLASTAEVKVQPSENEALHALAEFWTQAQVVDSTDAEAVKGLHNLFLDLFTPLIDQWWKAFKSGERATISRDPIRLPLEALSEAERAEAAQPDSPLASPESAGLKK